MHSPLVGRVYDQQPPTSALPASNAQRDAARSLFIHPHYGKAAAVHSVPQPPELTRLKYLSLLGFSWWEGSTSNQSSTSRPSRRSCRGIATLHAGSVLEFVYSYVASAGNLG
jgi:hypothetical protein